MFVQYHINYFFIYLNIIQVEDGKIEILDPELKKQLSLTTEDLRFADHLVRHVMEDRQDVFLDGTGNVFILV